MLITILEGYLFPGVCACYMYTCTLCVCVCVCACVCMRACMRDIVHCIIYTYMYMYVCTCTCVVPAGETPESLFKGKLMTCTVVGIVRRKPPREVLDRANPIENKATGYWQCPFCLKDDFRELSMVSCTCVS